MTHIYLKKRRRWWWWWGDNRRTHTHTLYIHISIRSRLLRDNSCSLHMPEQMMF